MKLSEPHVLDTNILVFAADEDSLFHDRARTVLTKSLDNGVAIFCQQNIIEAYNVLTRLGWTVNETVNYLKILWQHPTATVLCPQELTFANSVAKAEKAQISAKRKIFD